MSNPLSLPPKVAFTPVLHQMVDSGDLRSLHARAPALYLAIKRYADYHSGQSEVSNKRLQNITGMSKPTFYLARESLRAHGYIAFDETSHPPIYTIFERVHYYTSDRRPAGLAVVPYVPQHISTVLSALKDRPLEPAMVSNGISVGGLRIAIAIQVDGDFPAKIQLGVAVEKESAP